MENWSPILSRFGNNAGEVGQPQKGKCGIPSTTDRSTGRMTGITFTSQNEAMGVRFDFFYEVREPTHVASAKLTSLNIKVRDGSDAQE